MRLPASADFESAVADLFRWEVQRRAGLRVRASSTVAGLGAEVVLAFPLLPVRAPCRVVRVVDQPGRRGFTYRTLPGHPESGEESFLLERQEDGWIEFTIRAFSRPASVLAKAAGPLGRRLQDVITSRYLRAFDRSP